MRCLLVDDSVRFLEEAEQTLRREGITVVGTATTGDEARRLLDAQPVDVLLLDINLGAESGLELLAGLNAESLLGPTRVIMVSSYAETDFEDLIRASAAVGFLAKPALSARAIYEVLGGTG